MAENGLKLDDLQIDIVVNAAKAEKGLKQVASGFRKVGSSSNDLKTATKNIAELGKVSSASADHTEAVSKSLDETATTAEKAEPKLRAVTKTLKKTSSEVKNTAKDVKVSADTASSSVSKVTSTATKSRTTTAQSVKSTGRSLRDFAKSVDHSNGKLAQLWSAFKRIATYRAIRSAIRALTTAISEGFNMFVDWDREQNNGMAGAAKAVDELKAKWFELKGSIGAALAPIVQTVLPVIKTIADILIGIVNIIQQAVRALMGEEYWYRAIYKDAKGTTQQAKELQRILFGFDELNVLNGASGSGASSLSGTIDYIKEEIPAWMKIVAPLAAAFLGILATVKTIKSILDKLKTPITLATTAAGLLNSALGLVAAAVTGILALLGGLSKVIKVKTDLTDLNDFKKKAAEMQEWLDKNSFKLRLENPTFDPKPLKEGVTETNKWLKKNPLVILLETKGEGYKTEIKKIVDGLQKEFDKTPVKISVVFDKTYIDNSVDKIIKYIQSKFDNKSITIKANIEIEDKKTTTSSNTYDWSNDNSLGKKVGGGFSAGNLTGKDDRTIVQKALDWVDKNINQKLFGMAGGGFIPNTGTLFYAGEAGAEVVSNLGHSTGVMNVSQMQEAVASGNAEVVNAVYAMANVVAGAINSKSFDIYMDSQKVGKSVTQYQQAQSRRVGMNVV